jgi:phosphoribosylformylglycinamidine synthase
VTTNFGPAKGGRDPEVTAALAKEFGLAADEFQRVHDILGRAPNLTELGVFSAMWSEHCSYKSSRVYLKDLPTTGPRVIQGPGENAGVVDIDDGQAVVFKMESHNHPSFIEPFQGAATGVGGILRDVFTMGARPIASLNSLRFGDPALPKTRSLVEGVVAGIGFYGNCIGVPTVGGEVCFDPCYNGNCLVNAFTLGLVDLEAGGIFRGLAEGVGNPVLYIGAKTGRDGIHGATMASAEFDEAAEARRPTVQVGDPFTEKLLLEACLELFAGDALVGIQDMGAAGLTSSSIEMAARAGSGLELDLDKVPRRERGMSPYELMLSESQERMLLVAKAGREDDVRKVCAKWDIDCAVVGRVTDTGKVILLAGGAVVGELPIEPLTEGLKYSRPKARPAWLDDLQAFDPRTLPAPADLGKTLVELLAVPTIASKEWVYRQYDHQVRDGTVVGPGAGDAAVVRVFRRDGSAKGIALTVDCNSRFCYLDPFEGARLAVAENARNLVCVGAEPLAVTDCLNFGSPERPEIMWQFAEAVRGISDACKALGTPVVSGNVSLYNETDGKAIFPTPSVAMVGLLPDLERRVGSAFRSEGDAIVLLGVNTDEIGGSEYLRTVHGRVAGRAPRLDMEREKAVQRTVLEAARAGLLSSAHDCSEGGLAVALAESCIGGGLGADVTLAGDLRGDLLLFGEAPSRVVVSLPPERVERLLELARAAGAPAQLLGTVRGRALRITGHLDVPLADLTRAFREGFPHALGLA